MKRIFRGCEYDITIDNTAGVGNKVKAIYVNGELSDGNLIKPQGEKLNVTVVMG